MGYHIKKIEKGVIGTSSKILEEVYELMDSEEQECKVMALVELSDLIGAIELYLENNFQGQLSLEDLIKMSRITQRAFKMGAR